jgi:hypothetical protein
MVFTMNFTLHHGGWWMVDGKHRWWMVDGDGGWWMGTMFHHVEA